MSMVIRTDRNKESRWSKLIFDVGFNVVIPAIVLTRLSQENLLGPVYGLLVALSFPLIYGWYDFGRERNLNFFSIIGFVSILLTGGIGLLRLDPSWVAVKEASVPLVLGIFVIGSLKTKWPLVETLLARVINFEKINLALQEGDTENLFRRRLVKSTYIVGASFLLSAGLNYGLAKVLVVSSPGSVAFNEELGKLTSLSYPLIAIPSLIVFWIAVIYLLKGVEKYANLGMEDVLF